MLCVRIIFAVLAVATIRCRGYPLPGLLDADVWTIYPRPQEIYPRPQQVVPCMCRQFAEPMWNTLTYPLRPPYDIYPVDRIRAPQVPEGTEHTRTKRDVGEQPDGVPRTDNLQREGVSEAEVKQHSRVKRQFPWGFGYSPYYGFGGGGGIYSTTYMGSGYGGLGFG